LEEASEINKTTEIYQTGEFESFIIMQTLMSNEMTQRKRKTHFFSESMALEMMSRESLSMNNDTNVNMYEKKKLYEQVSSK
jgi:hypothetical protein